MTQLSTTQLVDAINSFTFSLQKRCPSQSISGLNVFTCLIMAACTFRGKTQQDLLGILGLGSVDLQTARLCFTDLEEDMASRNNLLKSNSAWFPDGLSISADFDRSQGPGLDLKLGVRNEAAIKSLIWQKTNGRITERLSLPEDDDALLLVSCLYFKANWATPFDPEHTVPSAFQPFDTASSACTMMRASGTWQYAETEQFEAVIYPYAPSGQMLGSHWAAGFVLPKESTKKALESVFESLASDNTSWRLFLKSFSKKNLNIFVPRFETRTKFDIVPALREMGLSAALSPSADFWATVPERELRVSQMQHLTFIKCDEFGTETAADVDLDDDSLEDHGKEFKLNRPFWFFVYDQTYGPVLYSGFIENVGKL